ncbi:MAG TPA: SPOR domain-containing protein [Rhizobiaceae bacterium]|nr:SPOR domain-containing protein [Rhizobiaceae bacterium]
MADTSQLRKNDPINFSEDDPFAELTRIMGFDPREAVKKSTPKPEPQAANTPAPTVSAPATTAPVAAAPEARAAEPAPQAYEPAGSDDFGIDLEKELLGEFADEPMEAAPAPFAAARQAPQSYAPAPEPVAVHDDDDLDAAFSESLEDELHIDEHDLLGDIDLSLDEHEVEAVAPQAASPRAVTPQAEEPRFANEDEAFAEVDMDFGADFESEMLADLEEQPRHVPEPVQAAAPVVSAPALELEDELNALLGNSIAHAEIEMPAQPEARGTMQAEQISRWARTNHPLASAAFERSAPVSYQPPAPAPIVEVAQPTHEPEHAYEEEPAYEPEAAYEAPVQTVATDEDNLDDLLDVMTAEVEAPEHAETHAQLPEYDHTPFTVDTSAYRSHDDEGTESRDEDYAPEVETLDVPEAAVAYADDLDLPEINYEEPDSERAVYDDLDADFASVFNEPPAPEPQAPPRVAANMSQRVDFDADFDALYRQVREAAAGGSAYAGAYAGPARQAAVAVNSNEPDSALDEDPFAAIRDEDFDDGMELPSHAAETVEPAPRRGLMIAAVVGGVALLGGVGAFALSFGSGSDSSVPVVVQADNEPVKVKPENPGGTSVPNQDNKVFETMAAGGTEPTPPTQEKLVSTTEEPVDIAAADPGARAAAPEPTAEDTAGLPLAPKSEDRIEPSADAAPESTNGDIIAVAPRKVKTMVVRSDGTLVPREEVAPAPATTVAEAPAAPALAPATDATPIVAPADETTGTTVPTPTLKPGASETTTTAEATASTPAEPASPLAPVAEEKPAEAAPEQVAVAAPIEAPAATAGAWSMQIASQPSAESAQATYEDLAGRYGSVIGGRGVNIVKAEIAGKGTYWRVRIPAETKNDAIKLCESYKAAGGNCFVSK